MKEFLAYIFTLIIGIVVGVFLESRARRYFQRRTVFPQPSTPLPDLEQESAEKGDPYRCGGD